MTGWRSWDMKTARVLVTGANGLIGQILWSRLAGTYDLHGVDVARPFSDRVVNVDVADYDQLAQHLKAVSPVDCVLHLAGASRVDAGWEAVLKANIVGTRNVYEAARVFNIRRVIFASSNHVTGASEGFESPLHLQDAPERVSPDGPVRPDSDYGVSKAFGEAEARYYFERWGVESICLRIGTVLPDDDPGAAPRFAMTWLSHRDLVQLIGKSMLARVRFGIYYGVSNNRGAFWDISNARADLGYEPVDDASQSRRDAE